MESRDYQPPEVTKKEYLGIRSIPVAVLPSCHSDVVMYVMCRKMNTVGQ